MRVTLLLSLLTSAAGATSPQECNERLGKLTEDEGRIRRMESAHAAMGEVSKHVRAAKMSKDTQEQVSDAWDALSDELNQARQAHRKAAAAREKECPTPPGPWPRGPQPGDKGASGTTRPG